MQRISRFISDIYRQRHVIRYLAKREFMTRYAGTTGGLLWVIIQPLATVLIFWFVFSVGFRLRGPSETPFLQFFISGLAPWLLFSEVVTFGTNGVRTNLHLIKKTVFPSEVLPFVYIGAAGIAHLALLGIVLVVLLGNGSTPGLHILELPIYFAALCFMLVGLCWILSALNVFHRDIGQAMTIVLNLWFWLTPVVWSPQMLPVKYHWLIALNPMAYIVEGYRGSLLYGEGVISRLPETAWFVFIVTVVFVIGAVVFKRLKMEFADAI